MDKHEICQKIRNALSDFILNASDKQIEIIVLNAGLNLMKQNDNKNTD